jgi:hypothetical protein
MTVHRSTFLRKIGRRAQPTSGRRCVAACRTRADVCVVECGGALCELMVGRGLLYLVRGGCHVHRRAVFSLVERKDSCSAKVISAKSSFVP